jgi:hypothetical protein
MSFDKINPDHYKSFSVETIDMMVSIWGVERVADYCEITAFKYKMRIGSKPGESVDDDLNKYKWYISKARELRASVQVDMFP